MKLHFTESDEPIGEPQGEEAHWIIALCGKPVLHPYLIFAHDTVFADSRSSLNDCGECEVKVTGKRYFAGIVNGEEAKHIEP